MSRREWDAIVIGLGGIGSGAAYWLARSPGTRVLGLEQFPLFHERGESQDHSRIIRLSYHTPAYVELAKAAYDAWAAVEADLGEPLIVRTGGLDLFPPGAAIPMAGYTESMAAAGVPFEVLDAAETMRRWPEWRLDEGTGSSSRRSRGSPRQPAAMPPMSGLPASTAPSSSTPARSPRSLRATASTP